MIAPPVVAELLTNECDDYANNEMQIVNNVIVHRRDDVQRVDKHNRCT